MASSAGRLPRVARERDRIRAQRRAAPRREPPFCVWGCLVKEHAQQAQNYGKCDELEQLAGVREAHLENLLSEGAIATIRAKEPRSQAAKPTAGEGKSRSMMQSKAHKPRQERRIRRVFFRVFMLEGAKGDGGVKVAVFFVKLGASLGKCFLILGGLLFPMAFLKPAFCVFKGRLV